MKRYYTPDIVFGPVSEDEEVHSVYKASEVQALLRAVANEVRGMGHDEKCASLIWIPHYETYPCTCPRGRALALLGVKP